MSLPTRNFSQIRLHESSGFSSKTSGHTVQHEAQLVQSGRSIVTLTMSGMMPLSHYYPLHLQTESLKASLQENHTLHGK
jgi:hypothetical protein